MKQCFFAFSIMLFTFAASASNNPLKQEFLNATKVEEKREVLLEISKNIFDIDIDKAFVNKLVESTLSQDDKIREYAYANLHLLVAADKIDEFSDNHVRTLAAGIKTVFDEPNTIDNRGLKKYASALVASADLFSEQQLLGALNNESNFVRTNMLYSIKLNGYDSPSIINEMLEIMRKGERDGDVAAHITAHSEYKNAEALEATIELLFSDKFLADSQIIKALNNYELRSKDLRRLKQLEALMEKKKEGISNYYNKLAFYKTFVEQVEDKLSGKN